LKNENETKERRWFVLLFVLFYAWSMRTECAVNLVEFANRGVWDNETKALCYFR